MQVKCKSQQSLIDSCRVHRAQWMHTRCVSPIYSCPSTMDQQQMSLCIIELSPFFICAYSKCARECITFRWNLLLRGFSLCEWCFLLFLVIFTRFFFFNSKKKSFLFNLPIYPISYDVLCLATVNCILFHWSDYLHCKMLLKCLIYCCCCCVSVCFLFNSLS